MTQRCPGRLKSHVLRCKSKMIDFEKNYEFVLLFNQKMLGENVYLVFCFSLSVRHNCICFLALLGIQKSLHPDKHLKSWLFQDDQNLMSYVEAIHPEDCDCVVILNRFVLLNFCQNYSVGDSGLCENPDLPQLVWSVDPLHYSCHRAAPNGETVWKRRERDRRSKQMLQTY